MTTTSSTSSSTGSAASIFASLNGTSSTTSSANSTSASETRFLKLLTAQLQNQDPLNPVDNAQMTSQMAQISTVSGIEKLNTTLQTMMTNSVDSQAADAAALVGQTVLVPGSSMTVGTSGTAYGGVELAKAADSAKIVIKDSNGLVVRTMTVKDLAAGTNTFSWDGKNDAGTAVAAGSYTFSVTATQGSNSVTATALALGTVSSVNRTGNTLSLTVGGLGNVALSDIRKIY